MGACFEKKVVKPKKNPNSNPNLISSDSNMNLSTSKNINEKTKNNDKKEKTKDTPKTDAHIDISKQNDIQKNQKVINNYISNEIDKKNNNNNNYFTIEDIKKSLLILKSEDTMKVHIEKNSAEKTFNSKYQINLKVTIKRVKSMSDFKIKIDLKKKINNYLQNVLTDESEKRTIDINQIVTFNKDFIVNYDFCFIQPLDIIFFLNKSQEKLSINLGDIIGKPRQIYLYSFPNFDCEIEAIMQSHIIKEVQFAVGLFGDLKEKKIFYTIAYLGNRYDANKNIQVYKSDITQHDSKLIFKQINLQLDQISEDENLEDSLIEIAFFNSNNDSNEELGKEKFSIEQLLNTEENEINLINDIKAKIACKRKNFFSFLQFIYNDFHLLTTFCIDFSTNSSIHKDKTNFEDLLRTFLYTLVPYNDGKFFNCYSYGFKLIKTQKEYINELFPLSRKTPSTEIEDIIPNFEKGFKKFESLKNENDLGLIIKNFNDTIKQNYELEDKDYNLFILFASYDVIDGQNLLNELLETSKLNISIVIIGLGNGSFEKTNSIINGLNGGLLKRNCVKFIQMNNNNNIMEIVQQSLIDIPDSMIDFFVDNNILPTN